MFRTLISFEYVLLLLLIVFFYRPGKDFIIFFGTKNTVSPFLILKQLSRYMYVYNNLAAEYLDFLTKNDY